MLIPPHLTSIKHLKGVLFAYLLEVLNSPAIPLDKFKSKALSKKVRPILGPLLRVPPAAAVN
jgi:hypothetical protein